MSGAAKPTVGRIVHVKREGYDEPVDTWRFPPRA